MTDRATGVRTPQLASRKNPELQNKLSSDLKTAKDQKQPQNYTGRTIVRLVPANSKETGKNNREILSIVVPNAENSNHDLQIPQVPPLTPTLPQSKIYKDPRLKAEKLLSKLAVNKLQAKVRTPLENKTSNLSSAMPSKNCSAIGSRKTTRPLVTAYQPINKVSKIALTGRPTLEEKAKQNHIVIQLLDKVNSPDNIALSDTKSKTPKLLQEKGTGRQKAVFASTKQLHGRILFPQQSTANKRKLSSHDVTTIDTRNESKPDGCSSWLAPEGKIDKMAENNGKENLVGNLTKTKEGLLRITAPRKFGGFFHQSSSRSSLGLTSPSNGNQPYVDQINEGKRFE